MPPSLVALLLIAATLHVGWNLLLKQSGQRQLASWIGASLSGYVTLPFVLHQATPLVWAVAVVGSILQAGYFLLLAYGYEHYDLGLLYPIARGVAPLLSAIWAGIWLADTVQPGGILAILLIAGGTVWLGLHQTLSHGKRSIPVIPLLIALIISAYTIVDAFGTRSSDPLTYYSLCMVCTSVTMAPFVLRNPAARSLPLIRAELPRAAAIGALSFLSYLIVLSAYARAPVSYVAATREISIVIAALVGWLWLKEPLGTHRLAGAACVCLGVITLVLFG